LGEQVAKDMIAVRVGPDVRFPVVGAKSYFAKRSPLKAPQDLIAHNCINLRLPTYGGLYAWEFEKGSRELRVRVEGQLVFSSVFEVLDAALAGLGLAFVPEDIAEPYLIKGRLERALEEWCALVGLPPLLSEPPATLASLRLARRCAALPRERSGCAEFGGALEP
jgi:DNA-binding transcriptional LysR family regulator